ncbi:MAG TPA: ribosomal-processing cysteine protease Prp [Acholeplasmataceae bacterium]|nr:ribosomal-processing cysteine protease Prp [Acholeplasmataceae bacterium]
MINVLVKANKDNEINYLHVSGHANYSVAGSDIVCAAVSAVMYSTINLLSKVCPKFEFKEDENKATMEVEIKETNEFTNIALDNLVETLSSIERDYKKYIKIKFE